MVQSCNDSTQYKAVGGVWYLDCEFGVPRVHEVYCHSQRKQLRFEGKVVQIALNLEILLDKPEG